MTEKQIKTLSRRIAADLMTPHRAPKVRRLALVHNEDAAVRIMAGWGESALASRIQMHLTKALQP